MSWQSGQTQRLSWIGKEKDRESGLSDFGVRKQEDGRFLSIDILWEKYRSLTPYQYAGNNPLIFTDPTGKIIQFVEGVSEEFKQGYYEAVEYLIQSKTASKVLDYLENSEEVYTIAEGEIGDSKYSILSKTIVWNPKEAMIIVDNNGNPVPATENGKPIRPAQSAAIGLIHEMGHAFHDGTDLTAMLERSVTPDPNYDDKEERKTITEIENKVIKELNTETGRTQEVSRHNHKGKTYKATGPTTTNPEP